MTRRWGAVVLLLAGIASAAGGQQYEPEPVMPEEYRPEEFPTWARDLRRFEVIAIGSFPITFFATSLIYDFSIYASHDFQPEHAMGTRREREDIGIIMGTAAGVSLLIAAVDIIIDISRRNRQEKDQDEQRRVSGPDS